MQRLIENELLIPSAFFASIGREWFFLLSKALFNPHYGLFRSSGSHYLLEINPDSHVHPDFINYFRFAGRILGLAVRHAHYMDGTFVLPLYKLLLGRDVSIDDLEAVDAALYSSLSWMLANSITGVLDECTFTDTRVAFGNTETVELLPGGAAIPVTDDNKGEYIRLLVRHRLVSGIAPQLTALREGFTDVVPTSFMDMFDAPELELLLSGLGAVDVADWRTNTTYRGCDTRHLVVAWFWNFVEKSDVEVRARLLQFTTGTSRLPITGFADLQVRRCFAFK